MLEYVDRNLIPHPVGYPVHNKEGIKVFVFAILIIGVCIVFGQIVKKYKLTYPFDLLFLSFVIPIIVLSLNKNFSQIGIKFFYLALFFIFFTITFYYVLDPLFYLIFQRTHASVFSFLLYHTSQILIYIGFISFLFNCYGADEQYFYCMAVVKASVGNMGAFFVLATILGAIRGQKFGSLIRKDLLNEEYVHKLNQWL